MACASSAPVVLGVEVVGNVEMTDRPELLDETAIGRQWSNDILIKGEAEDDTKYTPLVLRWKFESPFRCALKNCEQPVHHRETDGWSSVYINGALVGSGGDFIQNKPDGCYFSCSECNVITRDVFGYLRTNSECNRASGCPACYLRAALIEVFERCITPRHGKPDHLKNWTDAAKFEAHVGSAMIEVTKTGPKLSCDLSEITIDPRCCVDVVILAIMIAAEDAVRKLGYTEVVLHAISPSGELKHNRPGWEYSKRGGEVVALYQYNCMSFGFLPYPETHIDHFTFTAAALASDGFPLVPIQMLRKFLVRFDWGSLRNDQFSKLYTAMHRRDCNFSLVAAVLMTLMPLWLPSPMLHTIDRWSPQSAMRIFGTSSGTEPHYITLCNLLLLDIVEPTLPNHPLYRPAVVPPSAPINILGVELETGVESMALFSPLRSLTFYTMIEFLISDQPIDASLSHRVGLRKGKIRDAAQCLLAAENDLAKVQYATGAFILLPWVYETRDIKLYGDVANSVVRKLSPPHPPVLAATP